MCLCSHLRRSEERRFEIGQRKSYPQKEKLIKENTAGTLHGWKKIYRLWFLGKENPKNHSICVGNCIEIDLLRKAYCSLCTDAASYSTDMASYSSDMVSYGLAIRPVTVPIWPVTVPIWSVTVWRYSQLQY